jgi:hypothetical protein
MLIHKKETNLEVLVRPLATLLGIGNPMKNA